MFVLGDDNVHLASFNAFLILRSLTAQPRHFRLHAAILIQITPCVSIRIRNTGQRSIDLELASVMKRINRSILLYK